jgi:hypothetical protein
VPVVGIFELVLSGNGVSIEGIVYLQSHNYYNVLITNPATLFCDGTCVMQDDENHC